jgi:hypothetical protein
MTIKYRYYFGGEYNPYQRELEEVYRRLTEERVIVDPQNERALKEVLPTLDSWADFVLSKSKATFWVMEWDIRRGGEYKEEEVYDVWVTAVQEGLVGEWLKEAEAEESAKAVCYYMSLQYERFCPGDYTVDFRLYLSESGKAEGREEVISLEPYVGD